MEIVLGAAALGIAALTLYSGFGLGTLLLPLLAMFYPPHIAVAATAVVHLLNNVLKVALVGRHAERQVLIPFVLPAIPLAFLGAWLLRGLAGADALGSYTALGRTFEFTAVGLVVGGLVLLFAVLELTGALKSLALAPRWIPVGGAASGLFGGLSGHQGALRSLVLLRAGLTPKAYVATGSTASLLVDVTRVTVYGIAWIGAWDTWAEDVALRPLLIAVICAFAGTFLGVRLLGKVTRAGLHRLVGVLLLLAGLAIALGLSR